ncbi:chromatin accessibility complex protein 1 isoform X1 [Marmota marmota marmota]|uniref:chromatin accessibility complex protein 1 isoform X1 n=1 Tax=Marmota marmota marmota TaxID=9994 RepID=UPI0020935BA6|nr:chromatin accessibility complex protein 1 isoform X1 [Marmota marmota marmota]
MADVAVGKDKCGEQRLVSLPLSRIRVIMKSSPEVSSINQEALVLTAKATHHLFFSIDRRSQKQPRMRPPGISEQHGVHFLRKSPHKLCKRALDFLPQGLLRPWKSDSAPVRMAAPKDRLQIRSPASDDMEKGIESSMNRKDPPHCCLP